jgi:Concanavalin A-like lectin/glucanases superfamily
LEEVEMKIRSSKPVRFIFSGAVLLTVSSVVVSGAAASSNLVSYYSFDDLNTAPAATDSISSNDAIKNGNPVPTSSTDVPYSSPDNLGSAQFDGLNYLEINNTIGDSFTICAWVKTASVGGGAHWTSAPIVDSETGGWALDFGFGINDQGKLMFGNGGYDNSAQYDSWVSGNAVVNDSNWHHVCATRDNSNGAVNLFVDGVLDNQGTTGTGILTSNPKIKIGNGSDGNQPFVGLIDDLRIYDSVLTAEEVAEVHSPLIPTPEPKDNTGDLAETGVGTNGMELLPWALSFIATGISFMVASRRRQRKS